MMTAKRVSCCLSLACTMVAGFAVAESCITSDPNGHTQNGGSPLPGTTTESVAAAPVDIDGVSRTESSFGPVDLFKKGMSIFVR